MKIRNIQAIMLRDFQSQFTSPIAYIVIAGFMVLIGWFFFHFLSHFAQSIQYHQLGLGKGPTITEEILQPLFMDMNIIFLFIVPFITMRLFAEEKKLHTIELLMSSPLYLSEIILGKFFSVCLMILTMLALTLVYPLVLWITGNPEWGPVLTGYLGTFLLASCYASIGTLFSSMTENQIVAGTLAFATGLFFWFIQLAGYSSPFGEILNHLSLVNHFVPFSQGLLNSSDIFYYLSFIGIGLFLTYRILDSYRWR